MAQGDLHKLLVETRNLLAEDTAWYRTFLNIQSHTYTNSVANVTREFKKEVGELYEANKATFDPMIKEYVTFLYKKLTTTPYKAYDITVEPGSSPTNFSITVTPKTLGTVNPTPRGSGSNLQFDSIGSDPFKRVINETKREGLKKLLEVVNAVLGPIGKDKNGNDTYRTTSTFLDTGHMPLGVAQKQIYNGLNQLSAKIAANPDVSQLVTATGVLARLKLTSKWVGQASKTVSIKVTDESYKANRSKATKEKDFKNNTLKALDKILSGKKDWANQKGSDSLMDVISKTIANAAIKKGAKGKVRRINKQSNEDSTAIKYTTKKDKIKDGGVSIKIPKAKARGFDISLIALLNAKLPPAVRANMTGSNLKNRTGRFSESARVVEATTTAQGYPSIGYTYQRSPYDVFDPVLGKAPWNTPGRDPKKLIEQSIRDIARDLAIGRFYVRRV